MTQEAKSDDESRPKDCQFEVQVNGKEIQEAIKQVKEGKALRVIVPFTVVPNIYMLAQFATLRAIIEQASNLKEKKKLIIHLLVMARIISDREPFVNSIKAHYNLLLPPAPREWVRDIIDFKRSECLTLGRLILANLYKDSDERLLDSNDLSNLETDELGIPKQLIIDGEAIQRAFEELNETVLNSLSVPQDATKVYLRRSPQDNSRLGVLVYLLDWVQRQVGKEASSQETVLFIFDRWAKNVLNRITSQGQVNDISTKILELNKRLVSPVNDPPYWKGWGLYLNRLSVHYNYQHDVGFSPWYSATLLERLKCRLFPLPLSKRENRLLRSYAEEMNNQKQLQDNDDQADYDQLTNRLTKSINAGFLNLEDQLISQLQYIL